MDAQAEDRQPLILNIVGETVALGPLRRDLLPLYHRWINDFGTLRTLGQPIRPMTLEQEEAWYDGAGSEGSYQFTLYERETLRPIGNTGLADVDFRHRTAEFGIMIGEPEARGKGYGTEAARLMLDYAFVALGLHNVMLRCYEFNLAGYHAYKNAGFSEIGGRREARFMGGKFWDEIIMEALSSEFQSPVLGQILVPDVPR